MGISGFIRDFVDKQAKLAAESSSKKTNLFFLNKWSPPEGGEWVVFPPASYVDPITGEEETFYRQFEAQLARVGSDGRTRYPTVACTCYNGAADVPCALHEYNRMASAKLAETQTSPYKPVPIREVYYFNVIRLGFFHEVEEEYIRPSDGAKRIRKVLKACPSSKAEGDPKHCPYCKAGAERHFGDLKYLRAGTGYMGNLVDIAHKVESHCVCGGSLYPTGVKCSNCGADLMDLESIPEPQRAVIWKNRITCQRCGETSIPQMVYACTNCNKPTPVELEAAVVKIASVSAPGGGMRVLSLEEYGGTIDQFIISRYGDKAMEDYLELTAKIFDFKANVSMTYEEQLQVLGVTADELKAAQANPLDD